MGAGYHVNCTYRIVMMYVQPLEKKKKKKKPTEHSEVCNLFQDDCLWHLCSSSGMLVNGISVFLWSRCFKESHRAIN